MNPIESLTEEILKEQIDYITLKKKTEAYKLFLIKSAKLDLENQLHKDNLQFDNGVALATTYAAMCIDDFIRTRQFIRGAFQAVTTAKANKKDGPVNLLYAGTGPFATLVLPLLTKYTPDELRLTLMEVNELTVRHLKQLIKELKIEDYIDQVICTDASIYQLEESNKIDILLSETMQFALVKEQQVPIMYNLVKQLNKDTIIIPHKIKIDLGLWKPGMSGSDEGEKTANLKILKTLWEFDRAFINRKEAFVESSKVLHLCDNFPFRGNKGMESAKLVLLTSIQVYKEEWITMNASGLTIPKIIFDMEKVPKEKSKISLSYRLSENPDYIYELT